MKPTIVVRDLSDDEQAALSVGLHAAGLHALTRASSRPQAIHAAFTSETADQLRALLHRSPRDFGHPTSLWTLELAAEEAHRQGLTTARVSGETIRATRARQGIRWLRAKQWLTSPDPGYHRKTGSATG